MTLALDMGAALRSAAAAGVATRLADQLQRRMTTEAAHRWSRRNYRGQLVSLREGPAVTAGLLAASLFSRTLDRRARLAAGAAVGAAALAGAYDDRHGSASAKGLRGHLAALASGEVSTGVVKAVVIGGSALVAAHGLGGPGPRSGQAVDALLVASCANLSNLFDLRPGRALKTSLLGAVALAWSGAPLAPCESARLRSGQIRSVLLGSVVGVAAAALPGDLGERTMLGDCGANAVGSVLGCAAVATRRRDVRWGGLAIVLAMTLVSERVSFSAVIERVPPLAALDALGRRRWASELVD